MKRSKFLALPRRGLWRDRKGATMALFAATIPALIGMAGLTVDVGRTFAAKRALTASAQSAALAGAYALQNNGGTASAATTAVSNWASANAPANVTVSNTTSSTSCNTTTGGLPSCSASSPNIVSVTQTGTVSTFFLGAFGRSSFTLTSTASAAKAGGTAQSLNVMFVLDATGSMGSTTDNGCTVPGISSPTRWQCALYSMQSVLKVMPTSLDKVGLMIFPGLASQYSPTTSCGSQPATVQWYTSTVKYQIGTTLFTDYNTSGSLSPNSTLVRAAGIYPTSGGQSPCLNATGGQGSYPAEVITKAAAALPVEVGRQNVIIFLSDGGFNADVKHFASGYTSKATDQCKQAVTAAAAATAANVKVYSVAYGASTSASDCNTDTSTNPVYTPCSTMQAIASDSTTFYTTSSTCKINASTNVVAQLPDVFKAITTTLTKPRLVSN